MNLEAKKYLHDMLEAAEGIIKFTTDLSLDSYKSNEMVQAAVERKFEIIGEALNRIGKLNPALLEHISDHQRIISFRNILAHGYDIIDHEIVWEAITTHLPILILETRKMLSQ
jgi:uncharacterized protein with HEPN domain